LDDVREDPGFVLDLESVTDIDVIMAPTPTPTP
jgi:hypothetical protein